MVCIKCSLGSQSGSSGSLSRGLIHEFMSQSFQEQVQFCLKEHDSEQILRFGEGEKSSEERDEVLWISSGLQARS